MSIYSHWFDEERSVIISHHDCNWDWQDLIRHDANIILPMLESVNHPVAIIVDLTQSDHLPDDDYLVERLVENGSTYGHCNVDMVLFVVREEDELVGSVLASAHRQYVNKCRKYYHTLSTKDAFAVICVHRGQGTLLGSS